MVGVMLFLGFTVCGAQEQEALEKHPGYVDFKALGISGDQEPMVEVNIKGSLLRLLAGSEMSDDPELGPLLKRLLAIRVETYELDSLSAGDYKKTADRVAKVLEGRGWETIVSARERGERAKVCIKTQDSRIVGLFVIAVERDEAAFVNIVGEVDPDEIGKLGHDLDISPLDSMDLPTKKAPKKDKSH
jgi:hypothetical protein